MALISSESMTLMVNGTLQSEFFTMFCPMRFTYSVTTGSVMNLVLFSISDAYPFPILISVSVEYQLPIPRPPMSRLPTALTSSMLPGFTLTIWLPGATTLSGSTEAAGTSPATGVVPGAGSCFAGSLPVFESGLESGFASGLASGFDAGVSPATGVVPGAGWAFGALAGGSVGLVLAGGVVVAGGAEGSDEGADCARPTEVPAQARTTAATASVVNFRPCGLLFITLTSGFSRGCRFASLDTLDASICLFGSGWEEYFIDIKTD